MYPRQGAHDLIDGPQQLDCLLCFFTRGVSITSSTRTTKALHTIILRCRTSQVKSCRGVTSRNWHALRSSFARRLPAWQRSTRLTLRRTGSVLQRMRRETRTCALIDEDVGTRIKPDARGVDHSLAMTKLQLFVATPSRKHVQVCVEFAIFSLFALLTGSIFPCSSLY